MNRIIMKVIGLLSLFGLSGCGLSDAIDKAEETYQSVKKEYEEYRGEGKENEPKPFTVVYQDDPNAKTVLISANCAYNSPLKDVYYETPADTSRALHDTQNFLTTPGVVQQPIWDIRYVDPVTRYMNGGNYDFYPDHSVYTGLDTRNGVNNIAIGTAASQNDAGGSITQSECIDGQLAGGTTINLHNAPVQTIVYGGPQSTYTYKIKPNSLTSPWHADGSGNLVLQASFKKPLYFNYEANIGGGVSFGLFLRNKRNGKVLNYVIALYAVGNAWIQENRGIQFDPTGQVVHVSTVASDNSWWSTKSPVSQSITEVVSSNGEMADDGSWPDLFRINIAYQNLKVVLQELATNPPADVAGQDFGSQPEDWEVIGINILYELEEEGGKARFSGSFKGFEAYLTQLPI